MEQITIYQLCDVAGVDRAIYGRTSESITETVWRQRAAVLEDGITPGRPEVFVRAYGMDSPFPRDLAPDEAEEVAAAISAIVGFQVTVRPYRSPANR